jgi:hypothetical protein
MTNPANAEALITRLLGTADVNSKDTNFEHAVAHVYLQYRGAITAGLVARIVANLSLPYRVVDYLKATSLLDTGPVAVAALDPSTPEDRLNAAAAVIGPLTVSVLFERLFAIDDQRQALGRYDRQLSDAHYRLVGALTATRQDVFTTALLKNAQTDNPRRIGLMADVLARHGGDNGHGNTPGPTSWRPLTSRTEKGPYSSTDKNASSSRSLERIDFMRSTFSR